MCMEAIPFGISTRQCVCVCQCLLLLSFFLSFFLLVAILSGHRASERLQEHTLSAGTKGQWTGRKEKERERESRK